jgi:predicted TIM-barrel fold metal-dependent hydrolase
LGQALVGPQLSHKLRQETNTVSHAIWLAQVEEDIIEPDLAIIDPHHHLWDYPESRYLLGELLRDTGSGHRIEKTVFVECGAMYRTAGDPQAGTQNMQPVGEVEFVQGVAAMSDSGQYGLTRVASGIVGHADLTLGRGVKSVLQALMAASPNRFRGIRHGAGWHASPAIRNSHSHPMQSLMLDATFREGFAVLGELGLSFDAFFYHHQLREFTDLARAFPDVTIILDHFGGPLGIGPYANQQSAVFSAWRDSVTELTDCHNVYFKLGGINMKVNGYEWHKRALPPTSDELVDATGQYYEHCIKTFGAGRCMFESNFPVDGESCSYAVLWNAFKKMSSGLNMADRQALFYDTAAKVYRL